ncbi:MAG: endonuclease/exonuclease/phosphatase family protein [Planctomycetota bacterium]|jgi:endonuclease/exonuclease/phosphatase family metal-dependent hydrolase
MLSRSRVVPALLALVTVVSLPGRPPLAAAAPGEGASGSAALSISCSVRAARVARPDPVAFLTAGPSGAGPAWSLLVQPSGAWAFRAASGDTAVTYEPTAPRQAVDDGRWHHVAVTVDPVRGETRFFLDGAAVAIYSGSLDLPAAEVRTEASDGIEIRDVDVRAAVATAADVAVRSRAAVGRAPAPAARAGETIRVLAWNIWHGGREDGEIEGVERVIRAIRESGADIVCMQETYGSGPRIADALGFHLFLRSSNLSVMSRFPIEETFDLYQPFRFGACRVRLDEGRSAIVCPLWINHLPNWWGDDRPVPGCDVQRILAEERATRGREIAAVLASLRPLLAAADEEPVIVGGDFNSMSHLDWSDRYAAVWNGAAIDWPVSRAMTDAGFVDAFRAVHPDVGRVPGRTWSPRFPEALQTRIDYVYVKGATLAPVAARMIDHVEPAWPSDHAAVLVELRRVDRAD